MNPQALDPGSLWRALVRRPLTLACWRDALYLLSSLFTGIGGFTIVVTAGAVAGSLSILIFGLPVAVLAAHGDRAWCRMERARVSAVLGRPVPAHYRPRPETGRFTRWLAVLGDPQTWLDALWMFISLPLGIVAFVVAVVVWVVPLGLLAAPAWAWGAGGWAGAHAVLLAIGGPLLALPALVLASWLVRGAAVAHAALAARLLGPTRAEILQARVQTLAETRAGAVDAAVSELQRVERDLHDGAQARLVALAMDLGLAEQRLSAADPETALEHVSSARGQARAAMAELRALVRGIGPSILQDRGLDAALTSLVAGGEPPVVLDTDLPDTEAGARETAAYFVVAEAVANARKHASASRITVRAVEDGERRLVVEVGDDGVGGAREDGGSGLSGLAKRVAALDGTLTVTSPAGGPTTVRAEFPCAS